MLDEKQNTAEAFFLIFMSIQYLASSIQYPVSTIKTLQLKYHKNPGPDLASKDLILQLLHH